MCPLCLSRDRCVWSRLPTMPQTGPIFVCFSFLFVDLLLYFSSLVFSPACFWTTWSSKVTVLEVYGSFWKGFFALKTGMAELTSCLSGFWIWTQSQRGMRCVSPRVCVGFCGEGCWECRRRGRCGEAEPLLCCKRRRLYWGEMTFRSFCFWFRQSLLKWRHYARGRQWHPLLASHGNRETDWRQRLLTVADIINFHEETKSDWNTFSKRLIHKHITRLEQPWIQTLSWKIISIIIWYVQLWSYKKANTLSFSFIQILRKLKQRVWD